MNSKQERDQILRKLNTEQGQVENITRLVLERFELASDKSWDEIDRPILAARLAALRTSLLERIRQEAAGAAIGRVVAPLNELTQEVMAVCDESDALMKNLLRIMELVANNERVHAETEFRRFATELKRHDLHESRVAKKGLH